MANSPRRWRRAEDELIVRQSRGELGIKELRQSLRANVTTIQRRANELGVALSFHRSPPPGRKAGSFPSTHDNLEPARIENDKLLERLRLIHGEPE